MRTFVAIDLDDEARRLLVEIQDRLRSGRWTVKWVEPENLHLTLQFLGEIPEDMAEGVRQAMRRAAEGIAPFAIEIDGLGWFPPHRPPNVVWAGVIERSGTLARLHERLLAELEAAGTPGEDEAGGRFHAHVTLGRVKSPRGAPELQRAIGETALGKYRLEVRALALKKSDLGPQGPRYTNLGDVALDEASGRTGPVDGKETRPWQ